MLVAAMLVSVVAAGASHAMAGPADKGMAGQGPAAVPPECYCAECGMKVQPEGRFASQIRLRDGKTVFFCDLGDMMLHYDGLKDKSSAVAIYVRDYETGEWTDGRAAFYLTGSPVRTPMRYGILAFSGRKAAEGQKAKSGGSKVVTFDEAIEAGVFRE